MSATHTGSDEVRAAPRSQQATPINRRCSLRLAGHRACITRNSFG